MLFINRSNTNKKQHIHLSGNLSGIDALSFRDSLYKIFDEESAQVVLDLSQVNEMDLTGFNAIVMLKKEAINRSKDLFLIVQEGNPVKEFIHLSKLTFNCLPINQIQ